MDCREFDEIADSYLSGELLVETNHELIRHLEHCADCRKSLAHKREFRTRLQNAVKAASAPDAGFAARLRSQIREQATPRGSRLLIPAVTFGGLLIAGLLGLYVFLGPQFTSTQSARADLEEALHQTGLMAALHDALGTHKDCGFKFAKNPPIQVVNDHEYAALKSEFPGTLELVEKHDCLFKGRKYSHMILRSGEKLISILKTASESASDSQTIVSVPTENLQIAEFQRNGKSVFVISDLAETENLQIARVILTGKSV